MNQHDIGRGIALSVLACTLFAFLSGYTRLLAPLNGMDIFAWRILWTSAVALAILLWRGQGQALRAACHLMLGTPRAVCMTLLMATLLGIQQWLFLWASINGRALEVSLGYFLLPLSMVLMGRVHYGERLDGFQRLAVLCALIGVAHELWMSHAFSWPTLVVALAYPPYFVLRRRVQLDSMVLFCVELLVTLPLALVMLACSASTMATLRDPSMYLLLSGLGVASMLALGCYLRAGKLLPLGLFGILGYVEPVLLVLVAVTLLGETLVPAQLGTYIPIWLSVGFTALHSVRLLRQRPLAVSQSH